MKRRKQSASKVERDITEGISPERALRENAAWMRALIETAVDGVILIDGRGTVLIFNPACEKIFGYSAGQVISKNVKMLMPEPYRHEHDGYIANYLDTRKPKIVGIGREVVGLRKDGSTFPMDLSVGEAKQKGGSIFVGIIRDLTSRKRIEADLQRTRSELARVARMTAVGQMAASIAHEINQPLAAIVANANAGLRFLNAEGPNLTEVREALTQIVDGGHRASEVIGSIRAIFKKDGQLKVRLDVNQVIRGVLVLVQGELQSQHIQLQTDLSEQLPMVSGVHIQLQQVIFNLLTNAIEAMSSTNGRARLLRVSSARCEPHDVLVTVEDSGTGINAAKIENIFDPFFTTKSHGMGLGLSICRSIIEAHNGRLSARSTADRGSVFQIALPAEDIVDAEW